MTQSDAEAFAHEWMAAWNRHDLDAILSHYAEAVEFTSPFIMRLTGDPSGTLRGRDALRDYFRRALTAYADLHFELHQVFAGVETLVIAYRSVLNFDAAEMMQVDGQGKAVRVWCHYR